MGVSKVVINTDTGEETIVDLTEDTVTPTMLAAGYTAHDASGEEIVGTLQIISKEDVTPVKGVDYFDGERGNSILSITTAPSSYTTATGGFTPVYRIALSTVLTQSSASKVLVGDTLRYNYYVYPVGYVDTSYVYLGKSVSIRGSTGATGDRGTGILNVITPPSAPNGTIDGVVFRTKLELSTVLAQAGVSKVFVSDTLRYNSFLYPIVYIDDTYVYCGLSTSIDGPAGTTPVKGKDYFTAADIAQMVDAVIAALPTLTITGKDSAGTTHTWTVYAVDPNAPVD